MDLIAHLKKFLAPYRADPRPFLLGFSGGTDSSVLFELLLALKFPFIAAHVDHGWREASGEEAKLLEQRAAECGVPFYSTRLDLKGEKGNLEEISRLKRYAYFKKLFDTLDVQALCLAHHRDDNMETTLVRFLQGYSLHHLTGMTPAGFAHGMPIVRPFLTIPKKELLHFPLRFSPLLDPTNEDEKFLRARIRALQQTLGKEIEGPITRISGESEELKKFMEGHLGHVLAATTPVACGFWLDLSPFSFSRFEWRYLVREFLRKGQVIFSHALVNSAVEALESAKANHRVQGLNALLIVDRRHLVLVKDVPKFQWVESSGPENLGWRALLRGEMTVFVPQGARLVSCESHFSHLWNTQRVPAFLRGWAPVLQGADGGVNELLTGRSRILDDSISGCYMKLVVEDSKKVVERHERDVII
jgi:tRNA(Ile)-lysidine synthase